MKPLIPTLSLQVTYQCNIECKHCGPYCGPTEKAWMTVDEIKDLIMQAAALGVYNVVFTGGEPTLLGPRLESLLEFIRAETPIKWTRIVTNGGWAKSPELAHDKLARWQTAGLRELNISCGEYHQEFVPVEYVANAYRAARNLGYDTVLLGLESLREGKGQWTVDRYSDAIGEDLLELDLQSPFVSKCHGISVGAAMRQGRGKHFISADDVIVQEESAMKSRCSDVLAAITAHPNGNVTACCGVMVREESLLNIGNWRTERLGPMLEAASDDLVLNWIRYLGLRDMKQWLLARDPNLTFSSQYTSICDLCTDIVYNKRCRELLLEHGDEKREAILVHKVASDAVTYAGEEFVYARPDDDLIG